ncbi:MAG TPA: hypothetical protein VL201_01270, partial [Patescibacteria group bacterium]|nr:hypothetical protein [Patescibacteria group bacterium]
NIFLKIICNNFTERQMNQFQQNINTLKPQLKDAFAYILVNEKDNHYYKLIFKNDFAVENTYASVRLVEEIKQNSLEEFLKNSFPNDYDMHLNYKKMLLYERSKDPRDFDFLAHLEYIFKLIKDKKISQNVAYVMLAYCIDNISRNALQTEFDILKISELLNTHVQDIGIRKQLAGIMYAPLIGYHGSFKDNKVNLVYKVSSYVDDNGFYLWDILLKKLPIILGEYKDKKDELDKFLDSIVTHINVQKCDRIAVAEQIFKSISEILNDQMLYLVLKQNDEAKISFEKSPFAPVFMKVSNIEYRTVVANACNRFSNFNKYDLIVNAMHNPNQFADLDKEKSVILANIPDNLRREFLNIFVTEFKKKNENMFIFGYTMFFDYVINNLDSFIPGFTLKEKIDLASNINNNSISMTNDEKIVITDNTDFLSLCLTNKERGYDKFVDNRNAFLEAIKAKSEKDLKRIKVAFLGSNTLKKLLVRFLVDDNIQNDDGLTNINMFLKMIYIFTSDSERSNAYKDIQEIIEWIEKKLHVQNVVKAIPIKIDRGYYYTLKFEQSSKSPQSFDRSPFGQLVNKTNTLIVQEKDAVSQQKENPDLGQKNIKTQSDVSLLTSELTSEEKQKLNETPKKSVAGVVVQQTKDTSSLVNEQANEGASAVGKFFKAIGNSTKWFFSVLWYGLTYPFLQAWNYYLINVN